MRFYCIRGRASECKDRERPSPCLTGCCINDFFLYKQRGKDHRLNLVFRDRECSILGFAGKVERVRSSYSGERKLVRMLDGRLCGLSSALSGPGLIFRRNFQVLFLRQNWSANLFQKGWLHFPMEGKHFPDPLNSIKARFKKLQRHL